MPGSVPPGLCPAGRAVRRLPADFVRRREESREVPAERRENSQKEVHYFLTLFVILDKNAGAAYNKNRDYAKRKRESNMERSAGILLPIFSLPSAYGIGSLGREARSLPTFCTGRASAGGRFCLWVPPGGRLSLYQCVHLCRQRLFHRPGYSGPAGDC